MGSVVLSEKLNCIIMDCVTSSHVALFELAVLCDLQYKQFLDLGHQHAVRRIVENILYQKQEL